MAERITGHTELIGLMAYPIRHSSSPAMHNEAFAYLGLDYAYLAFEVDNSTLEDAIKGLRALKMVGSNVSMPNKTVVGQYLDKLSPAAELCGAVNTIVNENGVLTGHITDGVGFVKNLEVNGVDVKGKKTVVLGAGGAATAIQVQLALDGASEVAIFNIDDEFYARAESTKEKLATRCPECKVTVEHLEDKEALAAAVNNADIVINATIMGMKPHEDVTLIDKSLFRKDLVVADTVYNPEKTKMILEAEEAGCQAIGGKGMLLYQGVVNYSLFTGKDFPIEEYQKFQAEQAK